MCNKWKPAFCIQKSVGHVVGVVSVFSLKPVQGDETIHSHRVHDESDEGAAEFRPLAVEAHAPYDRHQPKIAPFFKFWERVLLIAHFLAQHPRVPALGK